MNTASKQTTNQRTKENKVRCKECQSSQLVANRRGFSFSKMINAFLITLAICILLAIFFPSLDYVAVTPNLNIIGFILFFIGIPIAIINGFNGSKDIEISCINCGHNWIAGKNN